MKDLERLKNAGSAAERALLRDAAAPTPPPGFAEEVRQAVEARAVPRRRRRQVRLGWSLAATLLAGTALAFGVVEIRQQLREPDPEARPVVAAVERRRAEKIAPRPAAEVLPPATPETIRPAAAEALPRRAASERPAAAGERSPAAAGDTERWRRSDARPLARRGGLEGPGLALDDVLRAGQRTAPGEARGAAAPTTGRLVIARQGRREIALSASATGVRGRVRETEVSLALDGAVLAGKIGDESATLNLRRYEADGTIAGRPVGFVLTPTADGALLRGSLPGSSVRLELTDAALSFYPGCDRPLAAVAPGVYEGTCASGARTRVVVPAGLATMAPLPRLVLLGLFLTERAAVLDDDGEPHLFGKPDRPTGD